MAHMPGVRRSVALAFLVLAFFKMEWGRERRRRQRPQEVLQVRGLRSSQRAPVEEPGIHVRAFLWSKTDQRPFQRFQAQLQGGGLTGMLPVFALAR
jgi:hypothetical protein